VSPLLKEEKEKGEKKEKKAEGGKGRLIPVSVFR